MRMISLVKCQLQSARFEPMQDWTTYLRTATHQQVPKSFAHAAINAFQYRSPLSLRIAGKEAR